MTTARSDDAETISIIRFIASLLRHWRLTVVTPLAGMCGAIAISFLLPRVYAASAAFEPERSRSSTLTAFTGIAAQLGLSGAVAQATPAAFYAEVLVSRPLLEQVLQTRFADPRIPAGPDSVPLLDLMDVGGANEWARLDRGVRKLRKAVTVRTDLKTDVVRVTVESRYPSLAAATANELIRRLNLFNAGTRQSQARQRAIFLRGRLDATGDSLRAAEDRLRALYENNRLWQTSPALVFEEGRLRRRVTAAEELYATLQRNFETARIDEVNDTPVLTVIEPAIAPQRKSRPHRAALAVLTLAGLWLAGVAGAVAKDRLREPSLALRQDVHELQAVVQALRERILGIGRRRDPRA